MVEPPKVPEYAVASSYQVSGTGTRHKIPHSMGRGQQTPSVNLDTRGGNHSKVLLMPSQAKGSVSLSRAQDWLCQEAVSHSEPQHQTLPTQPQEKVQDCASGKNRLVDLDLITLHHHENQQAYQCLLCARHCVRYWVLRNKQQGPCQRGYHGFLCKRST